MALSSARFCDADRSRGFGQPVEGVVVEDDGDVVAR